MSKAKKPAEAGESPEAAQKPRGAGTRDSAVLATKDAEALRRRKAERAELTKARTQAQQRLSDIRELGAPDDHRLVIEGEKAISDIDAQIEIVDKSIAAIEAMAETARIVAPLIKAIGQVKVTDATNVTATLPLAQVTSVRAGAVKAREKASDQIRLCDAIIAGLGKLADSEDAPTPETLASLRPLRAVAVAGSDGHKVRVEVASTARREGTGTRAATPHEVIAGIDATKASALSNAEAAQQYIGRRVRGEGADYKSWNALAESLKASGVIDDALWHELTTTKNGDRRSQSWRIVLRERFGFETAPYDPESGDVEDTGQAASES